MTNKKVIGGILFIAIGIILAIFSFKYLKNLRVPKVANFEECVQAGGKLSEVYIYPPGCKTPDGKVFVQEVTPTQTQIANPAEEFCGSSSLAACKINSDCQAGGCSGQVCQAKDSELAISTCEWKDCYDAKKFNLECKCVEEKCQWGAKP